MPTVNTVYVVCELRSKRQHASFPTRSEAEEKKARLEQAFRGRIFKIIKMVE